MLPWANHARHRYHRSKQVNQHSRYPSRYRPASSYRQHVARERWDRFFQNKRDPSKCSATKAGPINNEKRYFYYVPPYWYVKKKAHEQMSHDNGVYAKANVESTRYIGTISRHYSYFWAHGTVIRKHLGGTITKGFNFIHLWSFSALFCLFSMGAPNQNLIFMHLSS